MIFTKKIDGKLYDATILSIVKRYEKRGIDRITMAIVREIYELLVYQYGDYPDISKDTVKLLRNTKQWDFAADQWFRENIRVWAAQKSYKPRRKKKR